ncbi:dipeptidyl aminopeptidase/acylaminoacyl peptidase [Pedobacter sp. AK017]|uniref:S9 family peptidase n=1 Tax=Pedobacter sp. AK017 TaxID=2723073 RepID=UPI00160A8C8E|nr:prolyl oligopeptidase family serine peptidase [Pedobacter sp. AK017]MBB5438587.1 dipeptidyl aminopeptidase/acylaminoacyl peptidase [Pedobacter sp. AK017]
MNFTKLFTKSSFVYSNLIAFNFFILLTCPLYGQVKQKTKLTPLVYHLWHSVYLDRISPDENWASYKVLYENSKDTLFVRNIHNKLTYVFPAGGNGVFTNNNFFICQLGNQIAIQNLKTGNREIISGIKKIAYSKETDQLIVIRSSKEQGKTLIIRSLAKSDSREIDDVTNFMLSPKGHHLLLETKINNTNQVTLINLKKINDKKQLAIDTACQFDNFTWQKNGEALAFVRQSTEQQINSLVYYIIAADKLYELVLASNSYFSNNLSISGRSITSIVISGDLKKIAFSQQNKPIISSSKPKSNVEVWNMNDKFTFKKALNYSNYNLIPPVAMWLPDLDQIIQINSDELPDLMITRNFEYAVLSSPTAYEPQFEQYSPRDFYIKDLKTQEKTLVLKNHPYHPIYPNLSPDGKYFVYFKEKDWWVYNISTKTHVNLTISLGGRFKGKTDLLVPESAYGNPGWSTGDKEIILYDQYDLWAITPDGKSSRRLTKGKELGITYRIANEPNKIGENVIFSGLVVDAFDLSKNLFLHARGNDEKTGYYRWNVKTGEQQIVYGDSRVDHLNYNGSRKKIFFSEQKFDLSPCLVAAGYSSTPTVFFESNPHQKDYFWGKSELITYQNAKGVWLKGALFYPSNYDPKIKYPMVVNIYDLQSSKLHKYENPVYEAGSINTSVLNSQGYFVFMPDIQLLEGNPGLSAADCVIAGTKRVIEKGIVDSSRIGLTGHSFGGYETAFIITQTNLFAAAIASGGITDLISFYHTINPYTGEPDMWRFKNQQWNMGGSPYELPELYKANSPIAHVQNVQTPVLLWTGKSDSQVDPHQTMEFYLALRRLGKKGIMLQYPNEGHALLNPDNRKDLTNRMLEWFDYYLKDKKSIAWITKGTAPILSN